MLLDKMPYEKRKFRKSRSVQGFRGHNGARMLSMSGGKAKFWRRRGGSSRMSMMSSHSTESRTLADIEEEFLHASEFGDIPTVRRLLNENSELNVDCIDALGRTALRLAVKNEHLEVVEVLLERSSGRHIYEAVLQAISAGHVQIAESILKHKRYLEIWKERKKFGDDDHFFKTQFEESQFSPDITPLILAAQKNQYEIVQLLLLRGERIQKPHKFGCMCQECVNKMKFDQLRSAKYRLNAYRGMASDAYISLSSKDPILTAFQLSKELKNLARVEKYFKQEYKELSAQLSEYVVKLLDRVRTQDELELVLNKTGKASEEKYSTLARLKLAVQYGEKRFVSHPSCQQRLDKSWFEGIGPFLKAGIFKRVFMILVFMLAYPFLNIIYMIIPNTKLKCLKVLRFPWIKFAVHSASYVAFLLIIITHTTDATDAANHSPNRTLGFLYPDIFEKYVILKNKSASFDLGSDLPVRQILPSITFMLISLWVVGFLYHECMQVSQDGFRGYVSSLYNLMDYTFLTVYTISFSLIYIVMLKTRLAVTYFQSNDIHYILENSAKTGYNLYWIVADRYLWQTWDPINLAEGLFAVANILSFSRISYLLPANEALGPLQISVGRMVKDILKCLCLISMVAIAFLIGLQNIYWYYNVRSTIEVEKRDFEVPAQNAFGSAIKTFRTVFWSVFGRGEINVVTVGDYDHHLTEDFGYVLYGVYNVIMVTVLINMLIAMMARSFQAIAEESDVEWKFARSILYLEYMGEGEVLPVPLNLAGLPRSFCGWLCDCCCDQEEEEDQRPQTFQDLDTYGNGYCEQPPSFVTGAAGLNKLAVGGAANRNGMEPSQSVTQVANQLLTQGIGPGTSDISAVDIYEGNMTSLDNNAQVLDTRTSKAARRKHMQRNSIPGFLDNSKSYQRVMQRIIQRYIFDIQREAEVTEDDFEEIKQDISSFRYEMLNAMRSREQQFFDLQTQLVRISSALRGQPDDDEKSTSSAKRVVAKLRERLRSQDRLSRDSFGSDRPAHDAMEEEVEPVSEPSSRRESASTIGGPPCNGKAYTEDLYNGKRFIENQDITDVNGETRVEIEANQNPEDLDDQCYGDGRSKENERDEASDHETQANGDVVVDKETIDEGGHVNHAFE